MDLDKKSIARHKINESCYRKNAGAGFGLTRFSFEFRSLFLNCPRLGCILVLETTGNKHLLARQYTNKSTR